MFALFFKADRSNLWANRLVYPAIGWLADWYMAATCDMWLIDNHLKQNPDGKKVVYSKSSSQHGFGSGLQIQTYSPEETGPIRMKVKPSKTKTGVIWVAGSYLPRCDV